MKFPEGVVIKKVAGWSYRNSFALDTSGCMWVWGYKFAYDDYYDEEAESPPEMCSEYKERAAPAKMDWLEKNGYKVLDFAGGEPTVLLKAQDKQGALVMLGMLHPDYSYGANEYFGDAKTKLVDRTLWRLDSYSAD